MGHQKKKNQHGDAQSNTTLVLQVDNRERKMIEMYKHKNTQLARLAVLTANNKITELAEKTLWIQRQAGRRMKGTTAQETNIH